MTDILLLLLGATLVNHLALTQLRGLRLWTGSGGKPEIAIGIATACVLIVTSACTYLLYHWLLLPYDLVFLRTPAYLLIIVTVAVMVVTAMQQYASVQYRLSSALLPLIVTNGAVAGVALINDVRAGSFAAAMLYAIGTAAGFALMLMLFSALCERIAVADVPAPFRGPPIVLITAALMSLAIMGVASLVPA